MVLRNHGKVASQYKDHIQHFYLNLREPVKDEIRDEYKKSMNSRTKERFMRVKRLNALLAACGEAALAVA